MIDHLALAKRIWDGRHRHSAGTCECQTKPDVFAFLADLTPAQFADYYIAYRRGLPSVEDIVSAIQEDTELPGRSDPK